MEVSEGTNNKRSTVCDNDIDQNRFSLPSVTSDVTSSGKLSEHIDFIDRYFTHYFCDKTKLLFLQHTNALICVVTLSDEHPVLKACKDTVRNADCAVKVSYQLSNGIDRSNPKVSGKGKKGAKVVGKDELLCEVTIGETLHPIMCSLSGSVIEVNEKLVENPELLWTDPRGRGYIAVLMLKRPRHGKSFLESTFKNMQLVHKSPEEISEEAEIEITISDNSTSQETSSNRTGVAAMPEDEGCSTTVQTLTVQSSSSSSSGNATYTTGRNLGSTFVPSYTSTYSSTYYDTYTSNTSSVYSSTTTDSTSDSVTGVGISLDATTVTESSWFDTTTSSSTTVAVSSTSTEDVTSVTSSSTTSDQATSYSTEEVTSEKSSVNVVPKMVTKRF